MSEINKQCSICGEYIPADSVVCEYCQERLDDEVFEPLKEDVEEDAEEKIETEEETTPISVNNKRKVAILIVSVACILIFSTLVFFVLYRYGKSTDTSIYTEDSKNTQQEEVTTTPVSTDLEDAKMYFNEKKYEKAAILLKKEIETNQNPVAYFYMGRIYQEQSYTDLAIDNFKKALIQDSNFFEPNFELTKIYFDKGDYTLTANYGESALKIKSNNKELLGMLLKIYADKEDLNKATKISKLLIKIDSNNPEANYIIGLSAYQKGDINGAIIHMKKAVDSNFNEEWALVLARLYIKKEQFTNAIIMTNSVLMVSPYNYEASEIQGQAILQKDSYLRNQEVRKYQQQQDSERQNSEDVLFN